MRTCKNCEEEKELSEFYNNKSEVDGRSYRCKSCEKARQNEYREKYPDRVKAVSRRWYRDNKETQFKWHKEWASRPENRDRIIASQKVNYEIRKGEMSRGDCQVCGKSHAQAHHDDYSKPLEVLWLCIDHHVEYHKKLRIQGDK